MLTRYMSVRFVKKRTAISVVTYQDLHYRCRQPGTCLRFFKHSRHFHQRSWFAASLELCLILTASGAKTRYHATMILH